MHPHLISVVRFLQQIYGRYHLWNLKADIPNTKRLENVGN